MALRSASSLLGRLPIASSSRSVVRSAAAVGSTSSLGRRTTYSLIQDPKQDRFIDGLRSNPLSAFEYDRQPPYAPLFPLYVPLSSLDPRTPPSVAAQSAVPLPRDIFGLPLRRDVLHACVVHHANLLKRGTTHTKNRAEVRGSGKKLYRQKGTGRARVADSGSGTRRGGGKRHGPRGGRDFSTDLPRKVRQLGFKTALSQKLREGRLKIVGPDGFVLAGWEGAGKTGRVAQQFDDLELRRPLLLHSPWSPPPAEGLPRALRANPTATLASISSVSVFDLLRSHDLVLDLGAVEWLVGKVRQTEKMRREKTFAGNAMVMRRRALGLSDFPAEGELDESKRMLAELEQASGLRLSTTAVKAVEEVELGAGVFGGRRQAADERVSAEAEEVDELVAAQEDADVDRLLRELEPSSSTTSKA